MSRLRMLSGAVLAALVCILLTGCWDYRGLDELTIVAGIALDVGDNEPYLYKVTFEIIDTQTPSEQGQVGAKILMAEGRTIYEAVNNANRQLHNEMYFGNTEVLIISEQLATDQGLKNLIDAFMREYNSRNNQILLISREATAGEILKSEKGSNQIMSYYIANSIGASTEGSNFTIFYPLFDIYNHLIRGTDSIVLPALRYEDKETHSLKTDGFAIFDADKMVGYLENSYVPGLLVLLNNKHGGYYTFEIGERDGRTQYASVSILENRASVDFEYVDGRIKLFLKVEPLVRAIEVDADFVNLNSQGVEYLSDLADKAICEDILKTVRHMQEDYHLDIFEFGTGIFRNDLALWKDIESRWTELFSQAEVTVESRILINDTGLIRDNKQAGKAQ